jgi:hypothetical protein
VTILEPAAADMVTAAVAPLAEHYRGGAGRTDIASWERVLRALHASGAKAETIANAFAETSARLDLPGCDGMKERRRWLAEAQRLNPTLKFAEQLSDLDLDVSSTCLKP